LRLPQSLKDSGASERTSGGAPSRNSSESDSGIDRIGHYVFEFGIDGQSAPAQAAAQFGSGDAVGIDQARGMTRGVASCRRRRP